MAEETGGPVMADNYSDWDFDLRTQPLRDRIAELDRQVEHRLCENIAQAKEIERLRAALEELEKRHGQVGAIARKALKYEYPLDYKPFAEVLAKLETSDE